MFIFNGSTPADEPETYKDLEQLRTYISTKFDIEPVMARSYIDESEKDNYSLCIHGRYFNDIEIKHPLYKYLLNYPSLNITKEKQLPSNVWIFTFPKEQCADILKGLELLSLDDEQLEALSREASSNAVLC